MNLFIFVYVACFYLWRRHIALSLPRFLLLAVIFTLAAFDSRLLFVASLLTLAPLTLHLAYLFGRKIRAFNRLGDYSYGLYICAFPVQQALVALFPRLSLAQMILFSLLSTLAFAWRPGMCWKRGPWRINRRSRRQSGACWISGSTGSRLYARDGEPKPGFPERSDLTAPPAPRDWRWKPAPPIWSAGRSRLTIL